MNSDEGLTEKILQDFDILVSERVLPLDMISKVIVLSQGALWKHRMVRQPSNVDKKSRSSSTESRIATHLLDLHNVLLKIASRELAEVPPEDAAQGDLAQRITAVFRRTIPALRMAGKWIRANTRYLSQAAGVTPEAVRSRGRGREGGRAAGKDKSASPVTVPGLAAFWMEYIRYVNVLTTTFPFDRLPVMNAPLEEDVEMVGFLPLRKYMIGDGKPVVSPGLIKPDLHGQPPLEDATLGLHPNEEQLMRICDMIVDAKAVAEDEVSYFECVMSGHLTERTTRQNTPVVLHEGAFEYKKQVPRTEATNGQRGATAVATPQNGALQSDRVPPSYDTDDDNMTMATQDDVPDDAVKTALTLMETDNFDADEVNQDDDYEEIVWNP